MKLIYCHECHDCRALDLTFWRTCACGNTGGAYDPIDPVHDRAIVSVTLESNSASILGLDVRWCHRTPMSYLKADPRYQFQGLAWPYEKEHKITRIIGRLDYLEDALALIESSDPSVIQYSDLRNLEQVATT